jgi:hypothetical protein
MNCSAKYPYNDIRLPGMSDGVYKLAIKLPLFLMCGLWPRTRNVRVQAHATIAEVH